MGGFTSLPPSAVNRRWCGRIRRWSVETTGFVSQLQRLQSYGWKVSHALHPILSYLILLILHYYYHHHRKHLQHAIATLNQNTTRPRHDFWSNRSSFVFTLFSYLILSSLHHPSHASSLKLWLIRVPVLLLPLQIMSDNNSQSLILLSILCLLFQHCLWCLFAVEPMPMCLIPSLWTWWLSSHVTRPFISLEPHRTKWCRWNSHRCALLQL